MGSVAVSPGLPVTPWVRWRCQGEVSAITPGVTHTTCGTGGIVPWNVPARARVGDGGRREALRSTAYWTKRRCMQVWRRVVVPGPHCHWNG
jgi:hypothetical protein